jgi:putative Holliday junction resolvase
MRFLAIDLGERRTGLAAGDDETRICAPLKVLEIRHGPRLIEELARIIMQERPGAIVIGLPLNMDGTEGAPAKTARELGALLQARTGVPAHLHDERLTSYAAEQHLNQSGRTHKQKKGLRDALAAAEILRDFLDSRRGIA